MSGICAISESLVERLLAGSEQYLSCFAVKQAAGTWNHLFAVTFLQGLIAYVPALFHTTLLNVAVRGVTLELIRKVTMGEYITILLYSFYPGYYVCLEYTLLPTTTLRRTRLLEARTANFALL